MGLLDWMRYGPPLFHSPLLQTPTPPTEQKLRFIQDFGAVPWNPSGDASPLLVHGPGAASYPTVRPEEGDGNSAVYACLAALAAAYIEAPLRVYRLDARGTRRQVTGGAELMLQTLLDTPNPAMTGLEVWHWVQWAKHVDGNAYLRKLRAGSATHGNVVALWPLSPSRVEIRSDGAQFISSYRWHYAPGQYDDLDPANVIHFRLGLDDRDPRKGLAPLKRLVRALTTDAAAEAWASSILQNGAMPGLLVKTSASLTPEQAEDVKAMVRSLYGADRRGDVGVLDGGAEMSQLGWSPEQMVYEALSRQPESRISGVLRVPAIVAGLGVGLDRATYSNGRTLTEFFTERTIIPLWQMDAAKIQSQLVPDFTHDPAILVAHDLTDVRALQEDEDAKYRRLDTAIAGGWISYDEARADVGLDPLPSNSGRVRRVPTGILEIPLGENVPAPTPTPPPLVAPDAPPAQSALASGTAQPALPAPASPATVTVKAAHITHLETKLLSLLRREQVTTDDLDAWLARARDLAQSAPLLDDLLLAVPTGNGHAP